MGGGEFVNLPALVSAALALAAVLSLVFGDCWLAVGTAEGGRMRSCVSDWMCLKARKLSLSSADAVRSGAGEAVTWLVGRRLRGLLLGSMWTGDERCP